MNTPRATADDWKAFANTYTELTKGTTAKPTDVMLERLHALLPFSKASGVLDNGCGSGNIMSRIIQQYGSYLPPSSRLTCSDWAPAMVEQVQSTKDLAVEQNPESQWNRVEVQLLDAMNLHSINNNSQSHVAAGWVFYSTANPQQCLAECKRILQAGGVIAVSSWQEIEWLRVQSPLSKLRPEVKAPSLPQGWDTASALRVELEKAGYQDVETHEVPVQVTYQSYGMFVDILLTKVPHIVARTKDFSAEERATLKEMMIEEIRGFCPTEPGALKGIAVVGLGRK